MVNEHLSADNDCCPPDQNTLMYIIMNWNWLFYHSVREFAHVTDLCKNVYSLISRCVFTECYYCSSFLKWYWSQCTKCLYVVLKTQIWPEPRISFNSVQICIQKYMIYIWFLTIKHVLLLTFLFINDSLCVYFKNHLK